jgi:MFS family permease
VTTETASSARRSNAREGQGRWDLVPMVALVFLGFLSVAGPLPALSLFVGHRLGFSTVIAGCAIGLQSLVTVLTRHRSGTVSDHRGPLYAMRLGLPIAAAAGFLYLASALLPVSPTARLCLLLAGRVVLGLGESLFLVSSLSWGIARVGPARAGRAMSWQGIALYAALGLGGPFGLFIYHHAGFAGVALMTIVTPLLALPISFFMVAVPPSGAQRAPFHHVVRLIWRPGMVQMLATIPFAALASFLALDYSAHGWHGAGLAIGAFAAGYVTVRLFGAHLPDRFGGARVATVSLMVQALGQALLWLAPGPALAVLGAALTGLGYSLIFPAMGVEAMRRVPPEQRGRAVGNFIAFFDIAIGLTGPAVGFVAGSFGLSSAFLVGALASLCALAMISAVRRMKPLT